MRKGDRMTEEERLKQIEIEHRKWDELKGAYDDCIDALSGIENKNEKGVGA